MSFGNEGRNYVRSSVGATAGAIAKTYVGRSLSFLPRWIVGKVIGGVAGGVLGILVPSNTIVSGREERLMLQKWRDRAAQNRSWSVRTEPLPPKPSPISTSPPQSSTLHYQVRSGERLWNMAAQFGYDDPRRFVGDFRALNPAVNPNRIKAGSRYNMPLRQGGGGSLSTGMQTSLNFHPSPVGRIGAAGSISYRVQGGDRLWNLAERFGYDNPRHFVDEFRRMNSGVNPNRIFAGRSYTMPLVHAPQAQTFLRQLGQGLR